MKRFMALMAVVILFSGCGAPSKAAVFNNQTSAPRAEASAVPTKPVPMQTVVPQVLPVKIGDDMPVSRALAAKMLALAFCDRPMIDMLAREIAFSDTAADKWYDRYINACVSNGFMPGGGAVFLPDSPLTVGQAQALLDGLDEANPIQIQITEANRDKPISYALWTELYMQLLINLGGELAAYDVAEVQTTVLATRESNESLPVGHLITAEGPFSCDGLQMAPYLDKEVRLLVKDSDIIAVISVTSETPTVRNAFIAGRTADSITIFAGGAERTYRFDTSALADADICDIQISGKTALAVAPMTDEVSGTIKSMSAAGIELKDVGALPIAAPLKVYAMADGTPKWKTMYALTIGTDIARFVMRDGAIVAAIIEQKPSVDRIRVVLGTTGFGGYAHENVEITCGTGFTVVHGTNEMSFRAGETLTVSALANSDLFGCERIYISPAGGGRLTVSSISRNWPNDAPPQYRGILELARGASGGYIIVNELSLEEYLYAVVPSEMPSGYGLEAAKVQAITARSYAYNQLLANRYYQYGANVDDSVLCQVYNNIPENDVSRQAVDETAGKCLAYRGLVVSANYFSTSSGMTANAGEVWADAATRRFPSDTAAYLQAVPQVAEQPYGDLRIEENAAQFFRDMDIQGYDSGFSWFRWNVVMTAEQLSTSINRSIQARYNANPQLIQTLQADGRYASREISTIGRLEKLEAVSRGEGGNITCMRMVGSAATVLVYTEYNIRVLLAPMAVDGGRIVLTRKDGSTVADYTLMPSAFFTMDAETGADGKLLRVCFYGGGNGHGVGMSQNGVKGMIDAGFQSEQILRHYYPGSTVVKIYE